MDYVWKEEYEKEKGWEIWERYEREIYVYENDKFGLIYLSGCEEEITE